MSSKTDNNDDFDRFLDSYVEELLAAPEAEVLDGENPDTWKEYGRRLIEVSQAEAGRRRLQAAKQRLASRQAAAQGPAASQVSIQEARAYLRKASNDPRFTLAARGLDEMSDEDALHLYEQIRRLEQADEGSGGNK